MLEKFSAFCHGFRAFARFSVVAAVFGVFTRYL